MNPPSCKHCNTIMRYAGSYQYTLPPGPLVRLFACVNKECKKGSIKAA